MPNQLCSLDLTFRRLDAAGGVLTQGFFSAGVSPARIAGAVEFGSSERREIRKAQVIDAVHVATHGSSPKFQFLRAWRVRNYAPAAA